MDDEEKFGLALIGVSLAVIGCAASVFHDIYDLDIAASIVLPILIVGGSFGLGYVLSSPESDMVGDRFPFLATCSITIPWLLIAYFLNHGIELRGTDAPLLVKFGYWMVMATPALLAFDLFMDRVLGINKMILARWPAPPAPSQNPTMESAPPVAAARLDAELEAAIAAVDPARFNR